MSYGGRNYIKGNEEFRVLIVTDGQRNVREKVWDETEAEHKARVRKWRRENPGQGTYSMPGYGWRKYHFEDRGIQPYRDERVLGPYATEQAARNQGGIRKPEVTKVQTGTDRRTGTPWTKTTTIQRGEVTWTDLPAPE